MPVYVSFLLLFADERLLAQAAAPGDVSDENPFVPFVPVLVSLHVVEHLSPEVTRVDRVGDNHVGGRAVEAVDAFNAGRRINVPLRKKLVDVFLHYVRPLGGDQVVYSLFKPQPGHLVIAGDRETHLPVAPGQVPGHV